MGKTEPSAIGTGTQETDSPLVAGTDCVAPLPLEFRWCQSDADIETAQQLTYFRSESKDQTERFRACLACRGDDVVGGVWQGKQYFDEEDLGVRVVLKEDQAWIFAAFVAKSARGQRIYPRLLNHVLKDYPQLDHLASINTTNRASIAAHRHFVHQETGRCVAIRILSITMCWAGGSIRVSPHLTTDGKRRPIRLTIEF